jgi:hypothetical protein
MPGTVEAAFPITYLEPITYLMRRPGLQCFFHIPLVPRKGISFNLGYFVCISPHNF